MGCGYAEFAFQNVFTRDENGIHHWASEIMFKRGDTSSLDPVWAIYGVLDLTREGRGDSAAYPNLSTRKLFPIRVVAKSRQDKRKVVV